LDPKGKKGIRVKQELRALREIPEHKARWDHKVLRVIKVKPAQKVKTEI
jgi:hypothetical protein